MIKLILTIIILIVITYIIITKETFYSNFLNTDDGHLNPDKCNYLPWGPSLNSCINYCQNPSKYMKPLLNNCTATDCLNKCINCEDIDSCQWYDPNVQDLNYELLSDKADSHLTLNVILENNQSVYGTEYNSNEVNIEW